MNTLKRLCFLNCKDLDVVHNETRDAAKKLSRKAVIINAVSGVNHSIGDRKRLTLISN